MLGHSDGSVTAVYNRYGYVREMGACLAAWANELLGAPTTEIKAPMLLGVENLVPAARPMERVGPPMQLSLLPPGTRLSGI